MYKFSDGGQSESGLKGNRYCGPRAVSIATGIGFSKACDLLKEHSQKGVKGSKRISTGVFKDDMNSALKSLGWTWTPAPKLSGRKARASDLPSGTYIARMARHYAAVIDGVVHDSWNSSNKMVYGYWRKIK